MRTTSCGGYIYRIVKSCIKYDRVLMSSYIRLLHFLYIQLQGGSNMTGTDLCVNKPHKSRSYLNHLVLSYITRHQNSIRFYTALNNHVNISSTWRGPHFAEQYVCILIVFVIFYTSFKIYNNLHTFWLRSLTCFQSDEIRNQMLYRYN